MPDWMLDWGWKVGSAAAQALLLPLFRSPKITGDRCPSCQRCNEYRVVGGIMRRIALLFGIGGAALGVVGAIMLAFDEVSLELGVLIIVLGFVSEIVWLTIFRQQRNATKCVLCDDIRPLEDEHAQDEQEVAAATQPRRKRKVSRKPRR